MIESPPKIATTRNAPPIPTRTPARKASTSGPVKSFAASTRSGTRHHQSIERVGPECGREQSAQEPKPRMESRKSLASFGGNARVRYLERFALSNADSWRDVNGRVKALLHVAHRSTHISDGFADCPEPAFVVT